MNVFFVQNKPYQNSYKLIIYVGIYILLYGCEYREFCEDDINSPAEAVEVEIHWSEGDTIPSQGLRVHLYSVSDSSFYVFDCESYNEMITLKSNSLWHVICYDYMGNENLGFRNEDKLNQFEIYSLQASSTYTTKVTSLPMEEPTVLEPYPYSFYVAQYKGAFSVGSSSEIDTLRLYPDNVLREFTFLIYGVEGAKNIETARGAVSGMSGSYFPYQKALSKKASTVSFTRVVPIPDGQDYGWELQHNPLLINDVAVYPEWFPFGWGNNKTGWTGDWLIGAFSTFGPVDINDLVNTLTIEVLSHGNNHYWARWGYWSGAWEEIIRTQITGALRGGLAWRKQNGGFDIILNNDRRLVIPPDVEGWQVDVNSWGDKVVPLGW